MGAKKRIKLRESNEHLNFGYQFYTEALKKAHFTFVVVLNLSYATVISNILMPTAKYDTYKVSFLNEYRIERIFFFFFTIHKTTNFHMGTLCG